MPDFSRIAEIITRGSETSMMSASQLQRALLRAKSLEDVIEVQSAFIRKSYEDYAELTRKLGELLTVGFVSDVPPAKTRRPDRPTRRALRFEALVYEAKNGMTDQITGLSARDRHKALFEHDE